MVILAPCSAVLSKHISPPNFSQSILQIDKPIPKFPPFVDELKKKEVADFNSSVVNPIPSSCMEKYKYSFFSSIEKIIFSCEKRSAVIKNIL